MIIKWLANKLRPHLQIQGWAINVFKRLYLSNNLMHKNLKLDYLIENGFLKITEAPITTEWKQFTN